MKACLFLLLFFTNTVFAQDTPAIRSFKIYSSILKEDRNFDLYIPPGAKTGFEVVYVLDGQAQFSNVVQALKKLGQDQKIVVGIGNIWLRDRDYTPTHITESPFLDSRAAAVSGGGANFITYLEKEFIPYIESHYSVSTSRVLIGHSLGGLMGIYIILNHPGLFTSYALIDPSMWWEDGKLLLQAARQQTSFQQTKMFLAIANTHDKDKASIEEVRKDTTRLTAQIRPTVSLLDILTAVPKTNFSFARKYYKDYDHMTVFVPAITDALAFLLK